MNTVLLHCVIFAAILLTACAKKENKVPRNYTEFKNSPKFSNPDNIRDRVRYEIKKPQMPDWMSYQYKAKFHPAWMQYCDPIGCKDYHKVACGLNRKTMRFQWFQSACHMILNNQCAQYRGFLKFDLIANKYCYGYVMFQRNGCPVLCADNIIQPICGANQNGQEAVLFKNECAMKKANCRPESLNEYTKVQMFYCTLYNLNQMQEQNQGASTYQIQ